MTQENGIPPQAAKSLNEEDAQQMRKLSHDLNNAMEIIIQTSYLVGMSELPDDTRQWVGMLEKGVQQATAINNQLREYIRLHS